MQAEGNDGVLMQLDNYRQRLLLQRTVAGLARWLLLLSITALVLWLAEGFLWLAPALRTVVLLSVVAVGLVLLVRWVVRPLAQRQGWWQPMDDMATASHVQQRDAHLGEQLITWLHLKRMPAQPVLLAAALSQKARELRPWDVKTHLPARTVTHALRWAAAALALWLLLGVLAPAWVGSVAQRWVRPTEAFTPPLPYQITALALPSALVSGEAHELVFQVTGSAIPQRLFLYVGSAGGQADRLLLQPTGTGTWGATLTPEAGPLMLWVTAGQGRAWQQELPVLQRPVTQQFVLKAVPPAYTGVPPAELSAPHMAVLLPEGTLLTWQLPAAAEGVSYLWVDSAARHPFVKGVDGWQHATRLTRALSYHLVGVGSSGLLSTDSVTYSVLPVPDEAPRVALVGADGEMVLPAHGLVPLAANATDDYGLSRAEMLFQVMDAQGADSAPVKVVPLALERRSRTQAAVQVTVDALTLGLKRGQSARVQLRVWDNDGVHGPKSAVTAPVVLLARTRQQQQEQFTERVDDAGRTLGQGARDIKQLQQDLQRLSNRTLQNSSWNYEENRRLQQTLEQLSEVQQRGQDASKKLEELRQQAQQQQLNNPVLQEQLKQIEQLSQQLRDPELAKYLKELAQRWEKLDQPEQRQSLQRLEDLAQRYQLSLERAYELFRQWKVERLAEVLKELAQELAQRQNELQDATRQNRDARKDQQLAQQQQQLAQETQQLEQGLDSLRALKEQTRTPQTEEIDSLRQQLQQTQQQQQKAAQQLQQHDRSDAQQQQQQAGDNLQQTAQRLQQIQESARQRQHQENLRNLRALLDNLLKLSFDQEALRTEMQTTRANDPVLKKKGLKQAQVQADYAVVNDSLNALARRVPEIAPRVLDEAARIRRSMTAALDWLDRRNVPQTLAQQGLAMASINVLANSLANVQKDMIANAAQQQGKGTPQMGLGGAEMSQLSEEQQEINEELRKLMQQQGPGAEGGLDDQALKQLADRQEQLRSGMEQYFNRLQRGRAGNGDRILEGVDETLRDFYNRNVSPRTLMRQELILNRMLELDRAERQRAYEEQRESQTGQDLPDGNPGAWTPGQVTRAIQREQLNLLLRTLDPFYRDLSDEYLKQQKPTAAP